jgi:hypothetical protein
MLLGLNQRGGPHSGSYCRVKTVLFSALLGIVAIFAAGGVSACQEPDPNYGIPGGIKGQPLPNEAKTGGEGGGVFGAAYDANANKPQTTLTASHTGKTGAPAAADELNCVTCHKANGTAPEFAFGGRIFADNKAVAGADVLVVVGDQKVGPVKSDADGFFWSPGAALKEGGKAYVRKDATERPMNAALGAAEAGGGCNAPTCHANGGTSGKITL